MGCHPHSYVPLALIGHMFLMPLRRKYLAIPGLQVPPPLVRLVARRHRRRRRGAVEIGWVQPRVAVAPSRQKAMEASRRGLAPFRGGTPSWRE